MVGRGLAGTRAAAAGTAGETWAAFTTTGADASPGASGNAAARCGSGTLRTVAGTSGFGETVARSSCTCFFVLFRANDSSSRWFSSVMTSDNSRKFVSVIAPPASISITAGQRAAIRATRIRLYAASSDKRRAWTQYENNELYPSWRYNRP